MNIKIVILSEKTPKYYAEARAEYEKRLSRFGKIKSVTVKSMSAVEKAVDRKNPLILIEEKGRAVSSEEAAELINAAEVGGISAVTVVIAKGFSPGWAHESVHSFSITSMELSSELLSVVCLEQIYRGYKILRGEKYHK